MMTDATTTVLLLTDPISCRELCAVFFGGSFAYLIENDDAVENCIRNKNFPDTHEALLLWLKLNATSWEISVIVTANFIFVLTQEMGTI